jgi:hypothetical protein
MAHVLSCVRNLDLKQQQQQQRMTGVQKGRGVHLSERVNANSVGGMKIE